MPKRPRPGELDPEAMFTVREIAARWRVSERHVQRMIHEGYLHGVNVGQGNRTHYRVSGRAVNTYEDRNVSA